MRIAWRQWVHLAAFTGLSFLIFGVDTATGATVSGSGIETVVVTATRRAEDVQNVPIAVTALSAETLKTQQVVDVHSLMRLTPNLLIAPYGQQPGNAMITIRGPANTDSTIALDQGSGLYLDGVYVARQSGANLGLYDVERVEILRGPQGTLFGRNTLGGAVNIIAKKPDDKLGGSIELTGGNYGEFAAVGVLNVPIADELEFRIVVAHNQHSGYAKSALTGQDINDDDTTYVRPQIRWLPSADWEVLLAGDYSKSVIGAAWVALTQVVPTQPLGIPGFPNGLPDLWWAANGGQSACSNVPDTFESQINPFSTHPCVTKGFGHVQVYGGSATVTGNLGGGVTFKSITAYRGDASENRQNATGTTPDPLETSDRQSVNQFTEEVQLYGKSFDDRLDWITGFYYFREHGSELDAYPAIFPLNPFTSVNAGQAINQSGAIYAQGTYSITDQLRFTAGLRYVQDTRDLTTFNENVLNGGQASPIGIVASCQAAAGDIAHRCKVSDPTGSFDYVPFTVKLDYRPMESVLTYVSYTRGFRSGGFNLRCADPDCQNGYDPERLNSIEVGEKGDFFEHHLQLNVDFFYELYHNIQLSFETTAADGSPIDLIGNFGEARNYGVELEAIYLTNDLATSGDSLTFSGELGTQAPRFTKLVPGIGDPINPLHTPVPWISKFTGNIGGDYSLPTGFGDINLHMDYSYRSQFYGNPKSVVLLPNGPFLLRNFAPPYGLINARLSAHLEQYNLEISLWGRNIGNKHYFTRADDVSSVGWNEANPADPATFGITLKYSFAAE